MDAFTNAVIISEAPRDEEQYRGGYVWSCVIAQSETAPMPVNDEQYRGGYVWSCVIA